MDTSTDEMKKNLGKSERSPKKRGETISQEEISNLVAKNNVSSLSEDTQNGQVAKNNVSSLSEDTQNGQVAKNNVSSLSEGTQNGQVAKNNVSSLSEDTQNGQVAKNNVSSLSEDTQNGQVAKNNVSSLSEDTQNGQESEKSANNPVVQKETKGQKYIRIQKSNKKLKRKKRGHIIPNFKKVQVTFPEGLSSYKEALLEVLNHCDDIQYGKTCVLKFNSPENIKEKLDTLENLPIAKRPVGTFLWKNVPHDPLRRVFYCENKYGLDEATVQNHFGASSITALNQGIYFVLWKLTFTSVKMAEAASQKTLSASGRDLRLKPFKIFAKSQKPVVLPGSKKRKFLALPEEEEEWEEDTNNQEEPNQEEECEDNEEEEEGEKESEDNEEEEECEDNEEGEEECEDNEGEEE